jgi:hypothetical protein
MLSHGLCVCVSLCVLCVCVCVQVASSESRKSFFQRQLQQDLASAISADLRQVLVLNLQRGSVVVDICLLPPLRNGGGAGGGRGGGNDMRTPKILAYELAAQVSDPSSRLHSALTTRHAVKALLKAWLTKSDCRVR